MNTLELTGLETAPAQVCGSIRLVPLLRRNVRGDLRLGKRKYGDDLTIVKQDKHYYSSYIPHGLVVEWDNAGHPVATCGTQLRSPGEGKRFGSSSHSVRLLHRMAKREERNRLRLLPLHIAMEGFLLLAFGGPQIAWAEYTRRALRDGLSPREEYAYTGRSIAGFEEALRVFEWHEAQVGVLFFVADTLASVFVAPSPEDYRLLHDALLEDFYGELIWQYALMYNAVSSTKATMNAENVTKVSDLRGELARLRAGWASYHQELSLGLEGRPLRSERVYRMGPFALERFLTDLDPTFENHIGEAVIRAETGEIEYLKSFRLSAAQTRRAYFLSQLAASEWNVERAAENLNITKDNLVRRIEKAGFGYLFKPDILAIAHRGERKE